VLLADPSTFEGGGTELVSLKTTVRPECIGDVFMHCGQMLHGGASVSAGVRYILVGFVEVLLAPNDPDSGSVSDYIADKEDANATIGGGDSFVGACKEGCRETEVDTDVDDAEEESAPETVWDDDQAALEKYWKAMQMDGT
jgi:hypothetical protein